ncbi:PREDICTED: basic-leucine zipper transcription factor A-like [Ceratosolen solmsi marchali]|uniref:Basic-leucine zipper transcription factor A-like n=1 Tax=Ceratosolen solmsi marchali TaxID=326594 RepID=A0AAJ6VKR9_9HYME|nr:PREDICTED: basic-leucine zipper transcription factor A-like [Ceratosolen solmsi marchali]
MKSLYLLSLLFFVSVFCNEKLELEDIEKDQLEYGITNDKKSSTETLHTDETKYSAKAETSHSQQQRHQYLGSTTPSPQELGNQLRDYAELQSYENYKYTVQPHTYLQEKYPPSADGSIYLHQNTLLTNPTQQHQQYYGQNDQSHHSQNDYNMQQQQQQQQQQHFYQQKTTLENNGQSVEQESPSLKNVDENSNKGTYYVNIPMTELLAYYRNLGIIHTKNKNDEQQISIPVYSSLLTENQVYNPEKVSYQPQLRYISYPKYTKAIFTKSSKDSSIVSSPQQLATANDEQYTSPTKMLTNSAYESLTSSPSSLINKPQKYRYYMSRQQYPQYGHRQQQQFLYANPQSAYMDIYNTPAAPYIQDNLLYDQHKHQYYVPTAYARELMMQIFHQTGVRNTEGIQKFTKQEIQEALHQDFSPLQYQGQKFQGTTSAPTYSGNEGFSTKSIYSFPTSSSASSDSKSLLDSYVPSHIIAAQDVNRYRERPIKLESGFLPSKINFIRSYKKRKIE